MTYRQTASEARAEYESIRTSDIALKQSANEQIDEYLDYYLPIFFDYCDEFGVDTAEPVAVFKWASCKFADAPTASTHLVASMTIH